MKQPLFFAILAVILSTASPSYAFAKYNPAADNPYIQLGADHSKKWYEFYKKDESSAYITKNSGYWYSAKRENAIFRGTKTVLSEIKNIVLSAL